MNPLIKNRLVVVRDCIKYSLYYLPKNKLLSWLLWTPDILSVDQTVEKIVRDQVSVSRFGDGEFKWILGIKQYSFQVESEHLQKRLKEVLMGPHPDNYILCLPGVFKNLNGYTQNAKSYWTVNLSLYRRQWLKLLKKHTVYYNAFVTRPYMDYRDKAQAEMRFRQIKRIWEQREVVIVEGEKTRLGMANDLLENAKSIERIIAPAVNAFSQYDNIFNAVTKVNKEKLILIALGPTATVMAYDLACLGYQAIDIGHIDIEYEWYLMGALKKVPVHSKFVNEASYCGGNLVTDEVTDEYKKQIIGRVTT